ncbi:MAG: two sigma54 transcriptional regulator [Proteobacteria bacterium]|nr:two sigma54 transcriptional regulator [Pseudomonadota bacterium]
MGQAARILVVDDDQDMLHLIGVRLSAAGYEVAEADSGESALISFRAHRPQMVITDLRMGNMDGLTLFDHLQAEAPTVPVMILTAHGTIPDAVAATRRGVFSFLTKPFDGQELLRRVADGIRLSPTLDPADSAAQWRSELLSVNVRMEELLRQARRVAEEQRSALLIGPSGAGKTTLARAIHRAGPRADRPFVTFSCTDHPVAEQEQMLIPNSPQCVCAQADGGVLYLQDVGALSHIAQGRLFTLLLAQLQGGDPLHRLESPGDTPGLPDVQVIAASPRPLDTPVAEGRFRSELYYLLCRTTLNVPPLSERCEDIPVLASHFLNGFAPGKSLAPEAVAALEEGGWPGNVRQLRNIIERVASACLTPVIPESAVRRAMRELEDGNLMALDDARREFERDYLVRLLQSTAGNVSQAARIAQRNRTEFYKLLGRHDLDPAHFKRHFR